MKQITKTLYETLNDILKRANEDRFINNQTLDELNTLSSTINKISEIEQALTTVPFREK
jgi:hypothetical protein